jgi:predicted nucleic acid-binding Zn ribbon protein
MKHIDLKSESRTQGTSSLGEAFEKLIQLYALEEGYLKTTVVQQWHSLFGPVVSKRTREVYYQDRKLYVKISSAPLKKELSMTKSRIIGLINAAVGRQALVDIVFL